MSDQKSAREKRPVRKVTGTFTISATQINDKGTLSKIKIENSECPEGFYLLAHPAGGGAMYFKAEGPEHVKVLDAPEKTSKVAKKFF